MTSTAVIVGNPKRGSRTLEAASYLVDQLAGPADLTVDLAEFGPALLDFNDAGVNDLVARVCSSDLVVVASPTYKASFTGLLKIFLDRIPGKGLQGSVAVPLMLSAAPGHGLAAELHLRPVLTELGATVPTAALSLVDSAYDDPAAFAAWLEQARPVLQRQLPSLQGVSS